METKAKERDFATAEAIRDTAVKEYNTNVSAFNKLYDAYTDEITNVNKRTGKASNQYTQEQTAPDFKKAEKVD